MILCPNRLKPGQQTNYPIFDSKTVGCRLGLAASFPVTFGVFSFGTLAAEKRTDAARVESPPGIPRRAKRLAQFSEIVLTAARFLVCYELFQPLCQLRRGRGR